MSEKVRTVDCKPIWVKLRGFRVVLYVEGNDMLLEREEAKKLRDQLSEALKASAEVEAIQQRLKDGDWLG